MWVLIFEVSGFSGVDVVLRLAIGGLMPALAFHLVGCRRLSHRPARVGGG